MIQQEVRQPEFVVVWEFQVKAGKSDEFERVYGPDGDWAQLFRKGEGYRRTELIRDLEAEGRYLTIDFWASREGYLRFSEENQAEYRAIDEKCESLTQAEALLGTFERFA
jgi:heme-degrading monooxygenase HmoA